jgi:hypothetical protein
MVALATWSWNPIHFQTHAVARLPHVGKPNPPHGCDSWIYKWQHCHITSHLQSVKVTANAVWSDEEWSLCEIISHKISLLHMMVWNLLHRVTFSLTWWLSLPHMVSQSHIKGLNLTTYSLPPHNPCSGVAFMPHKTSLCNLKSISNILSSSVRR